MCRGLGRREVAVQRELRAELQLGAGAPASPNLQHVPVRGLEDFLEALQRSLQRRRVGDELADDEFVECILVTVAACTQSPERKHLSHALRGAPPLALAHLGHHRLDKRCRQLGAGSRVRRRRLCRPAGTAEECRDEKHERTMAHDAVGETGVRHGQRPLPFLGDGLG